MHELIRDLDVQLLEALDLARRLRLPRPGTVRQVIVCGMGGSGIGGRLLAAFYADAGATPVATWPNYDLPAWAGPEDLVILVSYSGETEETLSAFARARRRGCPTLAITGGGRLAARVARAGRPVLLVPGGRPPRQAIGYLAVPLWVLCGRLGLGPDLAAATRAAARLIGRRAAAWEEQALRVSDRLLGKLPVIYADSPVLEPVAYRWRCELNENAKTLAHHAALPELDHNELVGWGGPPGLGADLFLVMLADPYAHPRNRRRAELTLTMIEGCFAGRAEFRAEGRTVVERASSLILLGDLVSYYLARKRGVNPRPVERIDQLKARLAE